MEQYTEAFVGIDTAKNKHALAIADLGREGEVRYLGEIDSAPAAVERMIRKLAGRYGKLYFCYEAGPTGYGLYRQVRALGHDCIVVAPSLVPKRPGERVKTNRRDAVTLARLVAPASANAAWSNGTNNCCRFCCATDGSTVDAKLAAKILRCSRVRPDKIADHFVHRVRHPSRRQIPGAQPLSGAACNSSFDATAISLSLTVASAPRARGRA